MTTVNRVILVGNLGKDPDAKLLPDGNPITKISIATSEKIKGNSATEWHNITFFGSVAKIASEYLKKGDKVYVEGKIKTFGYAKDGVVKKNVEIIGSSMQMLGSKSGNTSSAEPNYTGSKNETFEQDLGDVNVGNKNAIIDDDVPF